jgi:hypothetical protein
MSHNDVRRPLNIPLLFLLMPMMVRMQIIMLMVMIALCCNILQCIRHKPRRLGDYRWRHSRCALSRPPFWWLLCCISRNIGGMSLKLAEVFPDGQHTQVGSIDNLRRKDKHASRTLTAGGAADGGAQLADTPKPEAPTASGAQGTDAAIDAATVDAAPPQVGPPQPAPGLRPSKVSGKGKKAHAAKRASIDAATDGVATPADEGTQVTDTPHPEAPTTRGAQGTDAAVHAAACGGARASGTAVDAAPPQGGPPQPVPGLRPPGKGKKDPTAHAAKRASIDAATDGVATPAKRSRTAEADSGCKVGKPSVVTRPLVGIQHLVQCGGQRLLVTVEWRKQQWELCVRHGNVQATDAQTHVYLA